MRRFGQGPLPLRWRAIAAVPVPHRYLLLVWAAWFVWSGSGPPPLLWRAAASVSVLSQVRWYSMDDGFFYAALALYVLVVAAYYGQLNVVFRVSGALSEGRSCPAPPFHCSAELLAPASFGGHRWRAGVGRNRHSRGQGDATGENRE